ncbi:putative magnesium transporter NIPA8 [Ananas comosus]|uniref:Probable magnesium transporter n=1 Tax=Ananas comosus TaxID=4615 RepID=A0A199W6N0_ANACO|nr:putative magnesium transporter NIPA8 [Ananas comosus]
MGEWVIGALINIVGSIAINFGTNLLKLGHDQSLLAALGSIQFVSNIAFAYFVLSKTVSVKYVYTPEQLIAKYSNLIFLLYCVSLVLVVALNHYIYRRGEDILSASVPDFSAYWRTLLPFSYAVVSGAVGSCSVLFAKSLSNMLRLTIGSNYQLHSWFTYSMLLLFLSTAGFWMARLNEGLSLFDAILIVPMFQIAWTFFSICTGFVYFQEYQVFNTLRIMMFVLGMAFVFIGISLLAPDDSRANDTKDSSSTSQGFATDENRLTKLPTEETEVTDMKSFMHVVLAKSKSLLLKAKATCSMSIGLGEESISASSVLVMPMVSSRTTGFRGTIFDRAKFIPLRSSGWSSSSINDEYDDDADTEVVNLPLNATKEDLLAFFSYCGTVDKIQLQRDGDQSQKAFVTFRQPYALQIALLLNALDRRADNL